MRLSPDRFRAPLLQLVFELNSGRPASKQVPHGTPDLGFLHRGSATDPAENDLDCRRVWHAASHADNRLPDIGGNRVKWQAGGGERSALAEAHSRAVPGVFARDLGLVMGFVLVQLSET